MRLDVGAGVVDELGALQERVKAAFDPLGVLNPGRMEGGA